MKTDRSKLTTEQRNSASRDIDRRSALEIVDIINGQDALVAKAVAAQRRQIARGVEMIEKAFRSGGRLIYVGAGTSGRLGVLDASECPPTYGVKPSLVHGIIAGGRRALVKSVEGAEDRADEGAAAIDKKRVSHRDVVVGIAACGLTPFVHAAIKRAKTRGAATIFVTCAPQAIKSIDADLIINPVVGPEVVTGSTRMKAGTATKLVLNTLTTSAMIRMGKVYDNLMVDLRATNSKLRDRAIRIVRAITGVDENSAARLLRQADGHAKAAVVMHQRKVDLPMARKLLKQHADSLRNAMAR